MYQPQSVKISTEVISYNTNTTQQHNLLHKYERIISFYLDVSSFALEQKNRTEQQSMNL